MLNNNLKSSSLAASLLMVATFSGSFVSTSFSAPVVKPATVAGAHKAAQNAQQESVAAREEQAMQFFKKLLTCPVDQVPTWQEFVDEISRLLEGNSKFAGLRNALLSVRTKKGFTGKLAIAKALEAHKDCLPADLVARIKEMSHAELGQRVKC